MFDWFLVVDQSAILTLSLVLHHGRTLAQILGGGGGKPIVLIR